MPTDLPPDFRGTKPPVTYAPLTDRDLREMLERATDGGDHEWAWYVDDVPRLVAAVRRPGRAERFGHAVGYFGAAILLSAAAFTAGAGLFALGRYFLGLGG